MIAANHPVVDSQPEPSAPYHTGPEVPPDRSKEREPYSRPALQNIARDWISLQRQMLPQISQGLIVLDQGDCSSKPVEVGWPEFSASSPALVAAATAARESDSTVVLPRAQAGGRAHLVACPLSGRHEGAVAVQLDGIAEPELEAATQLIKWGAAWLSALLAHSPASNEIDRPLLNLIARVAIHHELDLAAAEAVGGLAEAFGCERVGIGMVSGRRVRLVALSDTTTFDRRTNLVRHIEGKLNDALGKDTPEARVEIIGTRKGQADRALCTVNLKDAKNPVGGIFLERRVDRPFSDAEVRLCAEAGELLGPLLELQRRRNAPLLTLAGERLRQSTRALHRLPALRTGMLGSVLAALVAVLIFATGEYRISAPATLEGAVQRAIVAPFDSFVREAHVRPGETVNADQVVLELDDRDLRLERRQRLSEREESIKQYREALAKLDHLQAKVLNARVEQAEAQLALLERQLNRTRLSAPFDGVVLKGDMTRSLGAPVQKGDVLLEIAPIGDFRVVLEVDDRDIADVMIGQPGVLTLSALPDERFELQVETIYATTASDSGKPVFRVEGQLAGDIDRLRPGMGGVAKINAGERRLLWVWFRGLMTRAQLLLWSWLP